MPTTQKGFTLIELLVVIAIICILSVVGITVFTGVSKGARDAKRRGDIDAVAKAYEAKASGGRYVVIGDTDFSTGKKPTDPRTVDYFNWLDSNGAGFKVCASLDSNPSNVCNTPATNCYCKVSSQGILNPSSSPDPSSTQYLSGLGGSTSQECDPNGTLLSGLVGYWKMDETASPFLDYSGNSNPGTWVGGVGTAPGVKVSPYDFKNAGSFDGSSGYMNAGTDTEFNNLTAASWAMWVSSGVYNSVADQDFFNGGYWSSPYGPMFYVPNTGNSFVLSLRFTDGSVFAVIYPSFTQGQWYHIVVTYDGDKIREFIDGSYYGAITPGTKTISHSFVNLGGGTAGRYWGGFIDDVRIYNRALSGPEISNLYNGGDGCIY